MSIIVPTITAYDVREYREQMERVTPFANRIHVDLMDGVFAPTKSPDIDKLWLPGGITCDVHIMYQHPHHQLRKLLELSPQLVIIQSEADSISVDTFIKNIKKTKVKVGVSLLAETSPLTARVSELIKKCSYVLIFSGHLGSHGGIADMGLLAKVEQIKSIHPGAEIGWDGGISEKNAKALNEAGIDVLNTGGAIQKATDPAGVYSRLISLVS